MVYWLLIGLLFNYACTVWTEKHAEMFAVSLANTTDSDIIWYTLF